jgi:hypothetical protein
MVRRVVSQHRLPLQHDASLKPAGPIAHQRIRRGTDPGVLKKGIETAPGQILNDGPAPYNFTGL